MRILTWNLGEAEEPALANIVATLREADADFVFLNEAMIDDGIFTNGRFGGHQPQVLAARCGYPWVEWSVVGGLANGGFKCVALLSRHPLSNPNPQPEIKDWNGWPTSGRPPGGNYRALEVQANVGGQTWFMYTLRFSAHEEGNFIRHCELLRDRIVSLPVGTPIVAAGDFNGGAHLVDGSFVRGPMKGDPEILKHLPPAIQNLIDSAGLKSATSCLPLLEDRVDQAEPDRRPPYIWATDLILFRAQQDRIMLRHGRSNIGAEAHEWVMLELGAPGSIEAATAVAGLLLPQASPVKPPQPVKPPRPPRPPRKPRPPKKPRLP